MSRTPFLGVLVALALVSTMVGAAGPARAQMNGDIVFATGRGTEISEVWTMESGGSNPEQLIGGPPGSIEVDPTVRLPQNSDPLEVAFARKSGADETYDLMV